MLVRMRVRFGLLFIAAVLGGIVAFDVAPVQAQITAGAESCQCWCSSERGAFQIQGSKESRQDCMNACRDETFSVGGANVSGALFLGCYTETQLGLVPSEDSRCWTQNECEQDEVEVAPGDFRTSRFGGQHNSCIAGEGYCYNPNIPITLNVALGDITQAGSIGEYVAALYKWLIPAASVLAIVMIMIGGIQYALARGNSGAISQAKERMSNAVIGLLLLMSAYTVAALIDPGLVFFTPVQPPKIRTVVFIDPDAKCNFLEDLGFTISPAGPQECGVKGTVTSIEDVDPEVGESTIEVGHECVWDGCEWPATCVSSPEAETGFTCQRCADSYSSATSTGTGVSATPGNCEQLNSDDRPQDDIYTYCSYSAGTTIGPITFTNFCYEMVYPETEESPGLDCDLLRSDAKASAETGYSAGCRAYDWVQARYSSTSFNEVDDVAADPSLIEAVCNADPCGFGNAVGGCKIMDMEELQATYLGIDCDQLSVGVSGLCSMVNSFTSPVGCFDAGAYEIVTSNLSLLGKVYDELLNGTFAGAASAASDYISNAQVLTCKEEGGQSSTLYCAFTL